MIRPSWQNIVENKLTTKKVFKENSNVTLVSDDEKLFAINLKHVKSIGLLTLFWKVGEWHFFYYISSSDYFWLFLIRLSWVHLGKVSVFPLSMNIAEKSTCKNSPVALLVHCALAGGFNRLAIATLCTTLHNILCHVVKCET